jgi:hypothetical protein
MQQFPDKDSRTVAVYSRGHLVSHVVAPVHGSELPLREEVMEAGRDLTIPDLTVIVPLQPKG